MKGQWIHIRTARINLLSLPSVIDQFSMPFPFNIGIGLAHIYVNFYVHDDRGFPASSIECWYSGCEILEDAKKIRLYFRPKAVSNKGLRFFVDVNKEELEDALQKEGLTLQVLIDCMHEENGKKYRADITFETDFEETAMLYIELKDFVKDTAPTEEDIQKEEKIPF